MEEDEDVILEGSCLHEHLKEAGFTDYEVISSRNNTNGLLKDLCTEKFMQANELCRKKNKIWSCILELTSVISGSTVIENSFLDSITWRLVEARVLVEEDLLILETLSPTMKKLSQAHLQGQTSSNETFVPNILCSFVQNFFLTPYIWFFAIFMAIMQFIFDLSAEFCLMVLIFSATTFILIRFFVMYQYKNCESRFNEIVSTLQDVNQTTWKCLRFLNEVQIIKSGVGPNSTALDILDCSYERSLCETFHSLLGSWRSYIHRCRKGLQLLELDGVESVHTLFSRRYNGRDLEEVTEQEWAFSICKEKRNEISHLSSTFLTEFLLCFEKSKYSLIFNIISSKELDAIRRKIDLLENFLILSRKVWLNQEPVLSCVVSPPKSYERLKVDVNGAVDTLSVKCRSLVYSIVQLQEIVGNSQPDDVTFEVVHQSCEDIKSKILSCNASLEDVMERSENFFSDRSEFLPSNLSDRLTQDNCGIGSTSAEVSTNPSPRNNLTLDQVIQDEVFEAFAEHKDRLEEDNMLFEDMKKEKQMKKKQKERCKRVLQEIQPILQERRKMWEERETKAINRMKHNDENSPSESYSVDSGINSPVISFVPDLKEDENLFSSASLLKCSISKPEDHTCPKDVDEDCDSEEERLSLYKRVRKELDEDEARRKMEDDSDIDSEEEEEEEREKEEISRKKSLFTLPLKIQKYSIGRSTEQNDISDGSKNGLYSDNLCICNDNSKDSLPTISQTFDKSSKILETANSDVQNASLSDQIKDTYSDIGFSITIPKDLKEISSHKTDIADYVEDNSYSCGESSGEEEGRVLDWSTCGFRGRRSMEEGDVKVMSFVGVSTLLSSVLEKNAQVGEEEVFGGVGEGESEMEEEDEHQTKEK